jgi:succinate dehydrogenase/fumarate reductase flavoprotein subunit
LDRSQPTVDPEQAERVIAEALEPMRREGGENIFSIRREVESLMWDEGGIVRSGPGLESVIASLEELGLRAAQASVPDILVYNQAWQEWLDVRSILTVAQLTCRSALARRESRGSHYRSDYPEANDHDWLCNVLIQQGPQGSPTVWQEGVEFTRLKPNRAERQG